MPVKSEPVIVTTEFRGVFYGELKDTKKCPAEITLTNVRNCLYWSAEVGGFLGLASVGPIKGCKIGKKVKQLTLYKVTSITPVEKEAAKVWEAA